MADETIKQLAVQVAMDSGSFSSGVKNLKTQLGIINSGFKASVSGVKDWGTSLDGLKANAQALGDKINVQKQIVQAYAEQLDKSKSVLEQNSQKMLDLKGKVESTRAAYEESKSTLGANDEKTKALKSSLDALSKQYSSAEGLVRKNNTAVNGYTIQLNNAKGALNKMDSELSENNSKIKSSESTVGKLKSAFSKLSEQSKKSTSGIKSSFGSLKGVIAGFATSIVAGLSISSIVSATDSAEKTMAQMDAVLKSTGGAAGMTKQQLIQLADSQSKVTTYSKGTTMAAENMMLTFTGISSKTFPAAIKAAEDYAAATGGSATSAAQLLGKALNDPATGFTKLTRVGITFSSAQKEQIKTMEKAGNTAGAQGIILDEFSKKFGGSATAAASTFTGQIQIMTNNLKGAGVTVLTSLMPIITNTMPSIVKGAQSIAAEITSHKGEIIGAVTAASNIVKTAFSFVESHGTLVKGAIIGIAGAIGIWKTAMTVANTISTVSNALHDLGIIKSGAAAGAKLAEAGATGIATTAQNGFNVAMLPTIGIVAAIVAAIALLAVGVYELITHWKQVSTFFVGLWNGVKATFTNFWNWLKTFFAQWGPLILTLIAPVIGIPLLIIQHWGQISAFFVGLWNGIKSGISTAWNAITSVIMAVLTPLINGITGAWAGVSTGISNILNGLKLIFTSIFDAIKTAVLGTVLLLCDLVTGNWTKLQQDAGKIFGKLASDIQNIWKGIQQVALGIWQAITSALTGLWNGIIGSAKTVWGALTSFFKGLWSGIQSALQAAWNSITSFFTRVWQGDINTAKTIWGALTGFFTGLWNTVTGFFKSAWSNISSLVSSAWNGIAKFLSNPSLITDAIKNGFNSAIDFIKSLPAKMLEWGKDMITGLINGIKGMTGDVGKAVTGVGNKIRSLLHFSVPDEGPLADADKWMPDFMDLLAKGISNNKSKVINQISNLSKSMSSTVKESLSTISTTVSTDYDDIVKKIENRNAQLQTDVQAVIDGYNKQVSDLTSSLMNTTGIFSDTQAADSSINADSLTSDLQDQVTQLQDYQTSISSLQSKGVSGSLLTELQKQGPAATQQLQALNSMTSDQLSKYVDLWNQKSTLASTTAVSQLTDAKNQSLQQIKDLQAQAATDLQGYVDEWNKSSSSIESQLKALSGKTNTYGKDMISGIISGINSEKSNLSRAVDGIANEINSKLHFSRPDAGPLANYETWMPDFMSGLANGISANKYKVAAAIQSLSTDISVSAKAIGNSSSTNAASSSASSTAPQYITVNVQAKDLQEMSQVVNLFNSLQQARRAGVPA